MNILFVTSNRLGDAVLSTGVLGALIKRNPSARFTVVAGPIPAALFAHAPGVDRVILLEKRRWAGHWIKAWWQLLGTGFYQTVDLRGSALGYFLGCFKVKRRVTKAQGQHAVEEAASILDLAEVPAPRLWVSDADRVVARDLVGDGPFIVIGPTANFAGKQWSVERFAAVARALTGPEGRWPGASVVVLGAAHESPQAEPLLKAPDLRCLDLIGKPSLGVVAAILERAALFVGNDSGLMHMAAALNRPTVGVFGPSDPTRYRPYGPKAVAVLPDKPWLEVWKDFFERGMKAEEVMLGVSVDQVVDAALTLAAVEDTDV